MEKFTKMKLKELMNIEERLLHIQMTHMFDMPFNDIVLLNSAYEDIVKLNSEIDKLNDENKNYKGQISNIKKDIEKLDSKISKLENIK